MRGERAPSLVLGLDAKAGRTLGEDFPASTSITIPITICLPNNHDEDPIAHGYRPPPLSARSFFASCQTTPQLLF
jgi:hypothetical protein